MLKTNPSLPTDNVAGLICGAEFLEMSGRGNLVEVIMSFLSDSGTLASAEASLGLLADCYDIWPAAPKAKLLEKLLSCVASDLALYPTVSRLTLDNFVRVMVAARQKLSLIHI